MIFLALTVQVGNVANGAYSRARSRKRRCVGLLWLLYVYKVLDDFDLELNVWIGTECDSQCVQLTFIMIT